MVTRLPLRTLMVFLLLPLVVACAQIPEGWRMIGAEDAEQTRLLRAVSCGAAPDVGLLVFDSALPVESMKTIDALAVSREVGDLRIVQPDAGSLTAIFLMTGARVAIDDAAADSLPALLSPELVNASEPVAVILDLPIETFAEHFAQLTDELSGDAGASLRAVETTGQVTATLSQASLRRLESMASVCAVYPDAMLTPAE